MNTAACKAGIKMTLIVNNSQLETDIDGYLVDLNAWSPEVAQAIAEAESIQLETPHWEIINLVREFYRTYELSPAMRPLVKYTEKNLGKDKGKSIYLLQLFPPSPARIVCKIAGLPRPANCL